MSLEETHKDLMAEKSKHERLAANITDQMYIEAQVFTKSFFLTKNMYTESQVFTEGLFYAVLGYRGTAVT
jgi:hypothetical protein